MCRVNVDVNMIVVQPACIYYQVYGFAFFFMYLMIFELCEVRLDHKYVVTRIFARFKT